MVSDQKRKFINITYFHEAYVVKRDDVCMTLPGGGLRLQTLGRLATQLFDSTLRTYIWSRRFVPMECKLSFDNM